MITETIFEAIKFATSNDGASVVIVFSNHRAALLAEKILQDNIGYSPIKHGFCHQLINQSRIQIAYGDLKSLPLRIGALCCHKVFTCGLSEEEKLYATSRQRWPLDEKATQEGNSGF
jgi:hypothetical protein